MQVPVPLFKVKVATAFVQTPTLLNETGSPEVDEAIALHKPLEAFLAQLKEESTPMAEGYQRLEQILRGEETQN